MDFHGRKMNISWMVSWVFIHGEDVMEHGFSTINDKRTSMTMHERKHSHKLRVENSTMSEKFPWTAMCVQPGYSLKKHWPSDNIPVTYVEFLGGWEISIFWTSKNSNCQFSRSDSTLHSSCRSTTKRHFHPSKLKRQLPCHRFVYLMLADRLRFNFQVMTKLPQNAFYESMKSSFETFNTFCTTLTPNYGISQVFSTGFKIVPGDRNMFEIKRSDWLQQKF